MDASDAKAREVAAAIPKYWWIWLVAGIIWVVLSLVILQFNNSSITTVGVIIGILFLLAGLQDFFVAYVAEGWVWLWVIFGVVFVIAGIVALAYPKDTTAALADVLGFLFLLFAIFWTIEAFATRDDNPLWWMGLIAGILMFILAIWAAGQFFGVKLYTLLVFGGIWAMLHGIMDMIKAFQIKDIGKVAAS